MLLRLLALFLLTAPVFATVTITADVSSLSGGLDPDAYITVTVNNCASPTVWNTSTVIPATQNFYPQNGIATFNLYDNVTEVACQGNFLSYYTFALVSNGETTAIGSYELPPGRFNLANLAPIVTPPVSPGIIQGPKGDQGPVGPAGSAVPLTDTNLVANTSAILGSPAGSQTVSQTTGTYMNITGLEALGSPASVAFGQTVSVPSGFLSESTGGAFSLDTTAPGNALGTLNLANLNTAGLTIGNTAPNGHTLCGNGTHYVDCTLNYQTVDANSTPMPQRAALNFTPRFAVTDSSGQTNVDFQTNGVVAGSYTCPNFTVDAYGLITAASSNTCNPSQSLNTFVPAYNAVYQNTSTTRPLMVTIYFTDQSACTVTALVGSTSTPGTTYQQASIVSGGGYNAYQHVDMLIPAQWYYEVTRDIFPRCTIVGATTVQF